jgi:hypothetical protein
MITPEQLRWTEENEKSVTEYLKKNEAGEIESIIINGNIRDIIKNIQSNNSM